MKKLPEQAGLDPAFPAMPPPDPEALAEAVWRMLRKPKPEGGWGEVKTKPKQEGRVSNHPLLLIPACEIAAQAV